LLSENIQAIHITFNCCADGRDFVYGDTSVRLTTTTSLNKPEYQRTCIAEIPKQFSPAREMSVQSEVSTPLTRRSETWPAEKELTPDSDDRPVAVPLRKQLLKTTTSIVLLIGVVGLVGVLYGISEVVDDIRALSIAALSAIFIALLANALAAVLRFKIIATEIEHPITFRRAVAAVSAGSLAGALFFQIAGQLMARGVIAGREGMPFAAVVVITAYERITAAIISALFALGGALFIFGNLYVDRFAGGAELIKIMVGLVAATAVGALMGYGHIAARAVTPLLTIHFARRCLAVIGLTLLVHVPLQAAYVIAAHILSPQTPIADLIAASAIVMFATSVPISLAGWGMREMSAVVGLGAIGVPAHAALTAAITIGICSMLVVGALAVITVPGSAVTKPAKEVEPVKSVDYYLVLTWVLPIAAAILVLFQIYVPVQSGLLNVNLADPFAILGGVLFLLTAVGLRRAPHWRVNYVNLAVVAATAVLAISLFIGAYRFGWTTWAVVNRFLGWFVLLAYGATGALIVASSREQALRVIVLSFAGAAVAIAGLEVLLLLITSSGFRMPVAAGKIEGFSQNHNFFAFQLLMALAALVTFARGFSLRVALLIPITAALWFAGSRAGWIGAIFVLAVGYHLRVVNARETLLLAAGTAAVAALVAIMPELSGATGATGAPAIQGAPEFMLASSSNQERMLTITGGLSLFADHPLFGAGLVAFRNQLILATSGIPLLIHSTAVWLLAELGLMGFLVFTASFIFVFVKEWNHARTEPTSALIVLCFVAFAVTSGPADMLYQRTFWLLIGAALALPHAPIFDGRDSSQRATARQEQAR
jgi:hypothetical protein